MKLSLNDTSLDSDYQGFLDAKPFPILVTDNFLPRDFALSLSNEIENYEDFSKSNDYIFAKNKYENPHIEKLGKYGASLKNFLNSSEFMKFLSKLYQKDIFIDESFTGGGLHRGGKGSYLDMHVDFGLHPSKDSWQRELNLLLYLNKDWKKEYGGELILENSKNNETTKIEPLYNRMVIMLTKDFTFHGYNPINFPDGMYRTSIAAYAYSIIKDNSQKKHLLTTTQWAPNQNFFRKQLAKYATKAVILKQKLFGSSTAKKK